MFRKNMGIDLGTSSVLIYVRGKGIVLREPAVVAIDKKTMKILKVGFEAQEMLGRTPKNIAAVHPMRDGIISDYDSTEQMLRYFIRKANGNSIFPPNAVVCVPSRINEVEERAVRQAVTNAGAKNIELIEEPMAAALGAGLDIGRPRGIMVIDIGGGTVDIAVICLNDIVVSESVKCGGNKFDAEIVKYVRKEFSCIIGERTAEDIKIKIGCVSPRAERLTMTVRGRNMATGLPKEFTISSDNVMQALTPAANTVVEAVHDVLSKTPPELIADISTDGILMTGGGSLLYGFDRLLSSKIGIHVYTAEDALSCVVRGAGIASDHVENLSETKINSPRRKLWN